MRLLTVALITLTGSLAQGQVICNHYDAGLGTLPSDQGWVLNESGPALVAPTVVGGVLYQDTLPLTAPIGCVTSSEPRVQSWLETDTPFSFDDVVALEVEVQIEVSQYLTNPCEGWPRPGFLMVMRDGEGRDVRVGLGESQLFLANDGYVSFGSPGVVELAFDTTDAFHTYRLAADALGATLSIDGVPVLSVPHNAVPTPTATVDVVAVGDGTGWANAAFAVRGVSVVGGLALTAWEDLGGAVPGTHGAPCLTGDGTMATGQPATFLLDDARENAPGYWVWSLATLNAPFKGGVLVPDPAPPAEILAIGTGPDGRLEFPLLVPATFPSGLALVSQWWIVDPAAPFGFAASNGLVGTVP